ncbi:MAG TPA: hypothetical protein PLG50_13515 [bacterium]|nr:hypothetical protein [bacterium]HQG46671.1 hypothetical protein [bacterium]HQI47507.1 hypothetical protein [bacterium]HQJ65773.1 hypothetical protein [bacterium]
MTTTVTLLLLAAIGLLGYGYIRRYRHKPHSIEDKLMLVAVRRRSVGLQRSMEMTREEHSEINNLLERKWRILHERWIGAGAYYLSGFVSDAAGLPAPDDHDWRIMLLYGLSDYAMFRRCVDVLEGESNNLLRHHLEIRLVAGESMVQVHNKLKRIL